MSVPATDPPGTERRLRIVYCAVPTSELARELAREVVERRLAACASSWPIRSTYLWKGAIESAEEHAMLLKTSGKKLGALFLYLRQRHPYEVPDILELPVGRVHEPYLDWLLASLEPGAVRRGHRAPARHRGLRRGPEARRLRRTPARLPHQ